LADLVKAVDPLLSAKYVRFVTFDRPSEASRMRQRGQPWPYTEGLTIQEATNELAFLATGIYGHALPKQHGSPIRVVLPWKYGFKSAKSIVKIEFTDQQPATFWNTLGPHEYDFRANVNPDVPHPRWSQRTERMLGTGERRPTLLYNGYGDWVADLYPT
jgi:sulfoxide reductase catalytic subunit YedY